MSSSLLAALLLSSNLLITVEADRIRVGNVVMSADEKVDGGVMSGDEIVDSGAIKVVSNSSLLTRRSGTVVGGWAHVAHPLSSLVETQPVPIRPQAGPTCQGRHIWQSTGRVLGQGANGKVVEVQGRDKNYALKQSLSAEGEADIIWEKQVMQKTTGCPGVMVLTDAEPCTSASLPPLGAAYVSPKMAGNLWDWLDGKDPAQRGVRPTRDVQIFCGKRIQQELFEALKCFHNSGFVHGDLKGDNVFYTAYNSLTWCPTGIKLADYGLTKVINAKEYKFPAKYFTLSGHLPGSVFEHAPDTLGLSSRSEPNKYYAEASMDWCSFVYMMNVDYGMSVSVPGTKPGDCGMMGSDRRLPINRLG